MCKPHAPDKAIVNEHLTKNWKGKKVTKIICCKNHLQRVEKIGP